MNKQKTNIRYIFKDAIAFPVYCTIIQITINNQTIITKSGGLDPELSVIAICDGNPSCG